MNNQLNEIITKLKNQAGRIIKDTDQEKITNKAKEIDSNLSIKNLKTIVKILLVFSVIGFMVFTYWNYNLNAGEPSKIDITNKDIREVEERALKRYNQ